ncbi:unnamed protein product [Chrysoparadoxa australica]
MVLSGFGKKAGGKKAAPAPRKAATPERSIALPFEAWPSGLDLSLVGDVGFDPVGFAASDSLLPWIYAPGATSPSEIKDANLKWFREAELTHGRIAQMAILGWLTPEIYHFRGNAKIGLDAFAETNPLKALYSVPPALTLGVVFVMGMVETHRIRRVILGDRPAGDLGLGQGDDHFNPFGFKYSPEEYKEKQLQEIKHCRLAMIAILLQFIQTSRSGTGILEQINGALQFPEPAARYTHLL